MKLFYKSGACSLACHIALCEAGAEFSSVGVDLMSKKLENGDDFLQLNPKGQVPALLLNDNTLLTEGVAIMQYVADSYADSQLLPAVGSIARYKAIEWLNFIATELHKGFIPLFRPDTPDAYKAIASAQLLKKLEYVDASLAANAWINGAHFTVADGYLFTVLRWAGAVKLDISALKNISGYMARVAARPAVAAAMTAEGIE